MTSTLESKRKTPRALLNEYDVADALASYYALHHAPGRTELFFDYNGHNELAAFLVRCQTGLDLFRPLVTMRARGSAVSPQLLRDGLLPGRPHLLVVPEMLLEKLEPYLDLTDTTRNLVLRLDPARFKPKINVLVVESADMDGNPRCEIRRGDEVRAIAGVNWRSPDFAEIYVHVGEQWRGRGWGQAVVAACVSSLLRMQVRPLYIVSEQNSTSLALAEAVGFVDSGSREMMAQAVLKDSRVRADG